MGHAGARSWQGDPTMFEFELKLQVPVGRREALRKALATPGARTSSLQARYFDTADQRLAAAGLALRLRSEDGRWVQALKGRGDGLLSRPQDEHVLPDRGGDPVIDPSRHAGSEVGRKLIELLAGEPLELRYATDIRRLRRTVRRGRTRIELAFDEGGIVAGDRRHEVAELELELLGGPAGPLFDLAASWAARFGLWLDPRTKSERGHRLAQGLAQVPATSARDDAGPAADAPAAARRRRRSWRNAAAASACQALASEALASALAHALPNAAEIAEGLAAPEHLHQLRVGLRRLRSALRLYGPWTHDPGAAAALQQALREPFGRLSAARDADVTAQAFLPALQAAGAPPAALRRPPGDGSVDLALVLREPSWTALWLRALRLAQPADPGQAGAPAAPGPPEAPTEGTLRAQAAGLLGRQWRRARREAAAFAEADDEARHRLRKRLKRLRYGLEFADGLWPQARTGAALRALRDALQALGDWNDLLVAEAAFRARLAQVPEAWYALGWLAAGRAGRLRVCTTALKAFRRCPAPWE
jgi:triphosphatase